MNLNLLALDSDDKIRLFARTHQCTLEQVKRTIEVVGTEVNAVTIHLARCGLIRVPGHELMRM